MQHPLVNKDYLLEKFPGKGGWSYACIPEIIQNKQAPFGWVRVRGSIDQYEIKNYHLMPMGNGKLFLPVKASIRKVIKKQAGDYVRVKLFADDTPNELSDELISCFQDEPHVLETFLSHSQEEQKKCISWIYRAKTDDLKIKRIANTIDNIKQGRALHLLYKQTSKKT